MPLSLMLTELNKRRLEWLPLFNTWSHFLSNEEALLRRARGAFLRHWFGPVLQVATVGGLLVFIQNVEQLQSQYLYARAHSHDTLNLTEPVAGIAGGLIGGVLGFLMSWLVFFPTALAVVFGIVGGLIGAVGLVGAGYFLDDPRATAAYRLSAAIARVLEQFMTFWDWFTGPIGRIVNPFLFTLRQILDRIPVITAQIVAFVAVFFTRILPWLARQLDQIPAYIALVNSVFEFLQALATDLAERGQQFATSVGEPFHAVKRILLGLADYLKKGFHKLFATAMTGVNNVSDAFLRSFTPWMDEARTRVEDALNESALYRFFRDSGDVLGALADTLASHFPRVSARVRKFWDEPGFLGKHLREFETEFQSGVESETERLVGPQPAPGAWDAWFDMRGRGVLPDFDALMRGQEVANQSGEWPSMFSMASDLARTIRTGLSAPSMDVFAGEWARLGDRPREVLPRLQDEDLHYYRQLIGAVLDRTMPASASGYFAQLTGLLDDLTHRLSVREPRPGEARPEGARTPQFPALDVREEDRLRLEVTSFRVLYRGPVHPDTRETVQAFGSALRTAWIGQEYHMPSGEPVLVAAE